MSGEGRRSMARGYLAPATRKGRQRKVLGLNHRAPPRLYTYFILKSGQDFGGDDTLLIVVTKDSDSRVDEDRPEDELERAGWGIGKE